MAKRKRLAPPKSTGSGRAPEVKSFTRFPADTPPARPPIAHVAADAASSAALEAMSEELRAAREGGRMVLQLDLDRIDPGYLVRDRVEVDEDELDRLADSIRTQGQRTPIEVVALPDGQYGLISGWRRLTALYRLSATQPGGAFDHVLALLRQPETASDAYRAMVEENELRVGLSYYERARIVAKAAEQGVYPSDSDALQGLFGSVSRAKRSKIGSFLKLYHALDARLAYPSSIPERLGLALARALDNDPGLGERLADRLRKAEAAKPEDEAAILEKAANGVAGAKKTAAGQGGDVSPRNTPAPAPKPVVLAQVGAVTVTASGDGNTLKLAGQTFDPAFQRKLIHWLRYNLR